MQTSQIDKQREIDLAWEQHKNPTGERIPSSREIWEKEERLRSKTK
jgi:hypothetical protein